MKKIVGVLAGLMLWLAPSLALAEAAGGGYRGIAQIYYTFIAAVLIYGVYDTFGKKVMYVVGPIIVGVMYWQLP